MTPYRERNERLTGTKSPETTDGAPALKRQTRDSSSLSYGRGGIFFGWSIPPHKREGLP
jgi:hypothetical protein